MASKRIVLPPDLIERSERHGQQVVDAYRAGRHAASLAVSSHGAEDNPELQAFARMGECAFALYAGLDPLETLHWLDRPDGGYDIVAWGTRWDIKTTHSYCRYLIWPIRKRHIFRTKQFDVLALMKGDPPYFEYAGHIIKPEFAQLHRVAEVGHKLDPGTWYMHESELWGRA